MIVLQYVASLVQVCAQSGVSQGCRRAALTAANWPLARVLGGKNLSPITE